MSKRKHDMQDLRPEEALPPTWLTMLTSEYFSDPFKDGLSATLSNDNVVESSTGALFLRNVISPSSLGSSKNRLRCSSSALGLRFHGYVGKIKACARFFLLGNLPIDELECLSGRFPRFALFALELHRFTLEESLETSLNWDFATFDFRCFHAKRQVTKHLRPSAAHRKS